MFGFEDFIPNDFDRFGSIFRAQTDGAGNTITYVDITKIDAPIIPVPLPTWTHLYTDGAGDRYITGFTVATSVLSVLLSDIESYLRRPGIHYVLTVHEMVVSGFPPNYMMRSYSILPGSLSFEGAVIKPKTMREWLGDDSMKSRYPHVCPSCNRAAYVGFNTVECSAKCRPGW